MDEQAIARVAKAVMWLMPLIALALVWLVVTGR
jgi:hypothetical protein